LDQKERQSDGKRIAIAIHLLPIGQWQKIAISQSQSQLAAPAAQAQARLRVRLLLKLVFWIPLNRRKAASPNSSPPHSLVNFDAAIRERCKAVASCPVEAIRRPLDGLNGSGCSWGERARRKNRCSGFCDGFCSFLRMKCSLMTAITLNADQEAAQEVAPAETTGV
jgi:hypothetical protein